MMAFYAAAISEGPSMIINMHRYINRPSSRALRWGTASDAYLAKPLENEGAVGCCRRMLHHG